MLLPLRLIAGSLVGASRASHSREADALLTTSHYGKRLLTVADDSHSRAIIHCWSAARTLVLSKAGLFVLLFLRVVRIRGSFKTLPEAQRTHANNFVTGVTLLFANLATRTCISYKFALGEA